MRRPRRVRQLERVIIDHCRDADDLDDLPRLLDAGSFIGWDRFGFQVDHMPDLEGRVKVVRTPTERGLGESDPAVS